MSIFIMRGEKNFWRRKIEKRQQRRGSGHEVGEEGGRIAPPTMRGRKKSPQREKRRRKENNWMR